MDTKDKTAQGEAPERSSSLIETAAETPDEESPRCGALRRNGSLCKNYPATGGRCRYHVIDEVVPENELEALRQLQEAAAQHALDAFHAIEGGETGEHGEQDQAFNRNARTAAHLARIRQGLVRPGAEKIEGEIDAEGTPIEIPGDSRNTETQELETSELEEKN